MRKASFQIELLQYTDMLGKVSQQKVLAYLKTLLPNPSKKNNGKAILKFAGAFSKKDLEEMGSAIEDGCESIDKNEW